MTKGKCGRKGAQKEQLKEQETKLGTIVVRSCMNLLLTASFVSEDTVGEDFERNDEEKKILKTFLAPNKQTENLVTSVAPLGGDTGNQALIK
jgi:hypothetical protein